MLPYEREITELQKEFISIATKREKIDRKTVEEMDWLYLRRPQKTVVAKFGRATEILRMTL